MNLNITFDYVEFYFRDYFLVNSFISSYNLSI